MSSPAPLPLSDSRRIGLIAGWGRYPIVIAESLRVQGFHVVCLGIQGHADPFLRTVCQDFREVGLGKLGAAIRYFRRQGIRQATMAGKIHKVLLFQNRAWLKHLPDWRCVRTFYPHWITKTADRNDDSLLMAVVNAFAEDGIQFAPATDFVPELLVKLGILTGRVPTSSQQKDIEFGWRLAKEMGRLDVGQTVAVQGRAVLAVEAVEGTDECIRRAGQLCPQGGFTVVKVAKPRQDMRFDVPTIGAQTIKTLQEAGGRVLAIESSKTIMLDQHEVIDLADRLGIAIVAINAEELELRAVA